MDVNHLREFAMLISYGSYTSAARSLFMSQPSLSRHIAALEQELGQELFFNVQPLRLTKAGEIVMEQSAEILSSYDLMLERISSLANTKPECIRIQDLLHLDVLYTGITEAAHNTVALYPNVIFDYATLDNSYKPTEALLANQIDVTFQFSLSTVAREAAHLPEDQFQTMAIPDLHGELGIGIRKDSPLLHHGELTLSDFASTRFYSPATRHMEDTFDDFRKLCLEAGFSPKIDYVPANNQLDFYTRNPRDGAFIIIRMSDKGHSAFDRSIKDNLAIIRPKDEKGPFYVNTTMVVRAEERSDAFDYFLKQVEEIEQRRLADGETP